VYALSFLYWCVPAKKQFRHPLSRTRILPKILTCAIPEPILLMSLVTIIRLIFISKTQMG
jgi:hypothetical protein